MGRDIPFRFSVNLEYFCMRLITQTPTTATTTTATTTVFKVFPYRTPHQHQCMRWRTLGEGFPIQIMCKVLTLRGISTSWALGGVRLHKAQCLIFPKKSVQIKRALLQHASAKCQCIFVFLVPFFLSVKVLKYVLFEKPFFCVFFFYAVFLIVYVTGNTRSQGSHFAIVESSCSLSRRFYCKYVEEKS